MSKFSQFDFGEAGSQRVPREAFRGQDSRVHAQSHGKNISEVALKMQQPSSNWWKPDEFSEPSKPKKVPREVQTSSGVAQALAAPAPSGPVEGFVKMSSYNVLNPAPTKPRSQTEAELQRLKNEQAGLRIPPGPPAVRDNVVAKIEAPPPPPAPEKVRDGLEGYKAELELEARVDAIIATMRKFVEGRCNYGGPAAMRLVMHKLLKQHCHDTELTPDSFEPALQVFNATMSPDERDALFDRFDRNGNGKLTLKELCDGIVGTSKCPKADGEIRALLHDLKRKILQRNPGEGAVRSFAKSFQLMDKSNDNGLSADELFNGLQRMRIKCGLPDIDKLVKSFDADGSGTVNETEFLVALRGRLPRRRRKLIQRAFSVIDTSGDGRVTLEEVAERFDADNHPSVVKGEKTKEQVLKEFVHSWDKDSDSIVDWEEFLNYYRDISSSIELDDYFELMIRNCWHLSGGSGWAANTTCRRVLVTLDDDTQRVVEVKDDLGIRANDTQKIIAKLKSQGVEGIKEIALYS